MQVTPTAGEEWAASELHRVQGDLLAGEGKFDASRVCYARAVEAAQHCGSLAFERRLSLRQNALRTACGK